MGGSDGERALGRAASSATGILGFNGGHGMDSNLSPTPQVSVVIPTYNRLSRLQRVLGAFETQTFPRERFEVVVVSDGSSDGTDEFLAETRPPFPLTVVTQANAGPAAARNRGVETARGAIVLFVDDDVVAIPELIERHMASHCTAGRDTVVIGPMMTPDDFAMRPWVEWEQQMLYKQYDAMSAGVYPATFRQFYTGNASLPRARFLAAGGFDTRFRRAEDVELAYRLDRAGVGWVWNPAAIGHHYADRPYTSWLRTAHDYGVNEVVFGRDEGQDPTLSRVRAEFTRRSPVIRALARGCVAAPWLERVFTVPLRAAALGAHALGAKRVSHYALSSLFNMAYFSGMAEELGGRPQFERLVVGKRRRRHLVS
jgi:glycosyltransferase involved in cell wall biosynthesis